ncbi:MAG TPA: DUF3025 domain-containing protein [Burkholderiales bacterium]
MAAVLSERRSAALASPIFAPLAPLLARLPRGRFPDEGELNALVPAGTATGAGAALRFVPPSRASPAQYEAQVYETGEVPTRPGEAHDLFNALVWIAFPRTKAVFNRTHYAEMRARRGERLRGTPRDVLTLFDEAGVIVACADRSLAALLAAHEWKALFWSRRADVTRSMRFFVFGHAIYEKALEPYKGVTAKALIVDVEDAFFAQPLERQLARLDERAAAYFADPRSLESTRILPPLPVLGVPGWDPANESAAYYDDAAQFRPLGTAPTGTRAA